MARLSGTRTWAATLATVVAVLAPNTTQADDMLDAHVTRAGRLLQVRASLGADAPAMVCYAVLADFDHLEKFVPGLRISEVVSAPGEAIRLRQVGDAGAGFFHVTLDVTLAVRELPPTRIEFDRVAGNLRRMHGSWTVAGDDRHCVIDYEADIEPEFWVPPLIGPMLMRNQVETQLEGVIAEVRRRAAPAPGAVH